MKLLFKQRFLSWLGKYEVFDENENVIYVVKGKIGLGHRFNVFDGVGNQIGEIKQVVFSVLPTYEIYINGEYAGRIKKKFKLFKNDFEIDFKGWSVDGNFMGWDYSILGSTGELVAKISKQLFKFTDTYVIDVEKPQNALCALMLTIAIDAEKQSAAARNC